MDLAIWWALAAMLGYGVTSIIYKVASKSIDAVSMTFFTSLAIAIVTFIFWIFQKNKHITTPGIGYAVLAGVIASVAFVAFISSIQFGKTSIVTTLRNLSFAVTVILALLFLHEEITIQKIIGIALAVGAAILLSI